MGHCDDCRAADEQIRQGIRMERHRAVLRGHSEDELLRRLVSASYSLTALIEADVPMNRKARTAFDELTASLRGIV